MKRLVMLSLQKGCPFEVSPARYQLINQLYSEYEIYVFFEGHIADKEIRTKIKHIVDTRNKNASNILKSIYHINPDCVIASTYEDTNVIYLLPYIMRNTRFYYYNLEIYTSYVYKSKRKKVSLDQYLMIKTEYLVNKMKEIIYVKGCKAISVQDRLRQKIMKKNHITHPYTYLIPNSYVAVNETEFSTNRKGMIYSGGISKVFAGSLLMGVSKIDRVPLTLSGWSDNWAKSIGKRIKDKYPNISINDQKLSPEEYTKYMNGYAIGLIWYDYCEDENVYYIGLASGKFFKYLSMGQPVIVLDCQGISKEVEKYKLGIVINNILELEDAYTKIMNNYLYYQKNVIKTYHEKYDFNKVIAPLLENMRTE